MIYRFLACVSALLAVAGVSSTPVAGQATATTGQTESAPRTPWGHPDLRGTWTNTTTTPMERPADLEGKEFLTEEERAVRNPGSGISAEDRSAIMPTGAYNDFWLEKGELSLRTSVDRGPAGREVPTADARGRAASAGTTRLLRQRRIRLMGRFQHIRPMSDAWHAGRHVAWLLQPQLPDSADTGPRRHPRRDDSRCSHHPAGRTVSCVAHGGAVAGGLPRPLGGGHTGRRNDEPPCIGSRRRGALHPCGRRHDRLPDRGDRSGGVDGAVGRRPCP